MKTLSLSSPSGNLTRQAMDALCWREAARLSALAHEITTALSRGDLETALGLVNGDDADDEVLGVAI